MHALDIKLLRDFKRLWTQALAIAMVLACGVVILLTSFGMHRALDDTRAAFYERNRFADLWATSENAPATLVRDMAEVPDVQVAEGRIEKLVTLDLPYREKTASGRVISLPDDGSLPALNVPLIRTGRLPDPNAHGEVMVSEPFALANGYTVGDQFDALMSGQKRTLTITGTALSPEFIYAIGPGTIVPDDSGFGILWLPERMVSAAFDMGGAYNSFTLSLARDAHVQEVKDAIDRILDTYNTPGTRDRDQQESHAFVSTEIHQLKVMAVVLPPMFFGITAYLVNMVVGRIVALERAEIGLFKALGYTDVQIAIHFVLLAGLTAFLGVVIGWAVGGWLARQMAMEYAEFFKFPYLVFNVSYDAYAIGGVLAILTAALGAMRAALSAARMPPAVAMAPPLPPLFKRSFIDRILTALRFSQPTMMIWRSLVRWPLRAAGSATGLALAVGMLLSAGFFNASIRTIVDVAFTQSNRQDITLMFTSNRPASVVEEIRALPGVMELEPERFDAVELHNGHRSKQVSISARPPGATLARAISSEGQSIEPSHNGIVISARVAEVLHLAPGDPVDVEFLTGRKESHTVPVDAVVEQFFGLGAYMTEDAVSNLTRTGYRISAVNITLDPDRSQAFNAAIKNIPGIAGTLRITDMRRGFEDTLEQNITQMNVIFIIIAVLITIGLSYNGARIQLSERARELASLRILGFSRAEVSYILIGETMLVALMAQPLGWLIGYWVCRLLATSFTSDLYNIPFVLPQASYAQASLVVLGTSLAASLIVRRRIDALNLVSVMKTRE